MFNEPRRRRRTRNPALRFIWSVFWSALLRFLPALLPLLLTLPSFGADPLPGIYRLYSRGWTEQVCRGNYCEPGHWSEYQGSCVAFNDTDKNHQWFLTVGHVLHESNQVELPKAGRVPIRIRHRFSTPYDDAVFFTVPQDLADRVKVYELSDCTPKPGTKAWIAGFPNNRPGTMTTVLVAPKADTPGILETLDHGREGHSGGALLTLDETLGGAVLSGLVIGYDRNTERGLYVDVNWACLQLRNKLGTSDVQAPDPQPTLPAPRQSEPPAQPVQPTPTAPAQPTVPSSPSPSEPAQAEPVRTIPSSTAPVLQIPSRPSFVQSLGAAAADTLPWLVPLILGTAGTGGSLAVVAGGVKVLGWALKGLKVARQVHQHSGASAPGIFPPASGAPTLPPRDETEVRQTLALRQMEGRSPLHDALFGVLFQDEAESNPDLTLREALHKVNARFNQMAPLSVK